MGAGTARERPGRFGRAGARAEGMCVDERRAVPGRPRAACDCSRRVTASERSERAFRRGGRVCWHPSRRARPFNQSLFLVRILNSFFVSSLSIPSFRFLNCSRYVGIRMRRSSVGNRDRRERPITRCRVILPFLPLVDSPSVPRMLTVAYSLVLRIAWHVRFSRLRCSHSAFLASAEVSEGQI